MPGRPALPLTRQERQQSVRGEAPVRPGRGGGWNTRSGKFRNSKKIQKAIARREGQERQEREWAEVMRVELHPEWFCLPIVERAQKIGLSVEVYERYCYDMKFLSQHKEAVFRFTQTAEGKPLLMMWKKASEGSAAFAHMYGTKMLWFKEAFDRDQQRKNLRFLRQFLTMERDDLPDPEEVLGEARQVPATEPEEDDDGEEAEGDGSVRSTAEHPGGSDEAPDQPGGDGRADDERVEPPAGRGVRGQPEGARAPGAASVEPVER